MCLYFPKKKKEDRHPTRMMSFASHKHPLQSLRRALDIATIVSPTKDGFHKPPTTKITNEDGIALGTSNHRVGDVCDGKAVSSGTEAQKMLVLRTAIQEHLRRVYDSLRGHHETLAADRFVAFLKESQGETVSVPPGLAQLTFAHFLEIWYFQYGWDAVRPLTQEEMDPSRPISNYFINSSHNTYLSGNQLTSASSAEVYKKVLKRNCRCIEIDVWNGDASESRTPVKSRPPLNVIHGKDLSSSSFPKLGADASKILEEKRESFKQLWPGKPPSSNPSNSHSRNPSSQGPSQQPASARESTHSFDPADLSNRLQRPRASSKGSKQSKQSSTKSEPIVMHGWTFTSPVGFREVCRAIRESAFITNSLPIIVSLEVHADMEQQEAMVDIMKEEWVGVLLDKPHDECPPHQRQPRLDELENKIMVKVKKPPAKDSVPIGTNLAAVAPVRDDAVSDSEDERDPSGKKQPNFPICEALSSLSIYTHSEHFGSFELPAAKSFSHIFSISEKKIIELYATKRRQMLAHNRNFFMRAFPDGRRIDSSNPDPSQFWRKGVQMVAMNWQNWDDDMALNDAMFAGSQGWVLKPPGYRSGEALLAGHAEKEASTHKTLDLKITFYAGQYIPLPEARQTSDTESAVAVGAEARSKDFRPCVQVELVVHGPEEDEEDGKAVEEGRDKLKTEPGETEHPNWGQEGACLHFSHVRVAVEELSFVLFKIGDYSSYFPGTAAWACVRLDRLRPGYRFLDLLDEKGNASIGRLFVKIEKSITHRPTC